MSDGPLVDKDALVGVPSQEMQRILDKIQWLWDNREAVTHIPLKHNLSGFFKRRIGNYRIIYTYDDNPDELIVRLVGTRDDIYKEGSKRLSPEQLNK